MKLNMEVKTFTAPVADEYDEYPNAFCRVHSGHVYNGTSFDSVTDDSNVYSDVETAISGASYKIMFWNTAEAKSKGKLCRSLLHIVDGAITDVYAVDMDHPEAIEINNSDLAHENKVMQLIRRDLHRRSL